MLRTFSLILVVFFSSCSASRPDDSLAHNNWPNRSDLFHNFRNASEFILVYNKEDYDVYDQMVNTVQAVAAFTDKMKIILKEDDEITEDDFKNYPVYIAGSAKNLLIKRLDGIIPFNLFENGFEFAGTDYKNKTDILKISFYPNPFNPQLPVTMILGNDQLAVADYISRSQRESRDGLFWDNWGYQVIRQNKRLIIGNFSDDSTHLWSLDKKVHWEFDYIGRASGHSDVLNIFDHQSGISSAAIDAYTQSTSSNISSLEAFSGKTLKEKFDLHICPTVESIALAFNAADQTCIGDDDKTIYTVINNEYNGISNGYELIPAIRSMLGKSKLHAMENGLAVYFTPDWQGRGFMYWGNKLYKANALPELSELLDNDIYVSNSRIIIDCMAAMFVQFLIDTKGKEYLLNNFDTFENKSVELNAMDADWKKYLQAKFNFVSPPEPAIPVKNGFLKGFNFAHEGYEVYNGYMGTLAMQSLEKLKSIGANTVSIIPYSGFRSMSDPHPFRISSGAGGENDAAVIRSAYKAEQLGFTVMLKPQIWSWLGWTGDITMKSEDEWQLFFKYYTEWILHYAMLAEIHHVEIFCVGNEFKNATLTHQKEWENIFDQVRKIYTGKITYAANWGDEFENVTFWNKLDYVAVNCYYPLSDKANPTDEELMLQMEKNLDKIESVQKKYKKPLLFTEIGFKSIDSPWIAPHKDEDEQGYNEVSQKRCYEIMFKAMADEDWIKGVYLWKWPSYMDFSKEYQKDFNPCNKQAETVINEWFSKY